MEKVTFEKLSDEQLNVVSGGGDCPSTLVPFCWLEDLSITDLLVLITVGIISLGTLAILNSCKQRN